MFGSKKCGKCGKSIYHNDPQLALGGNSYHKSCARCATCNCYLTLKNFSTSGERVLCKTHFKEEFSTSGGVYAGDDKFKHSGSGTAGSRSFSRNNSIESDTLEGVIKEAGLGTSKSTDSAEKVKITSSNTAEEIEVTAKKEDAVEKLAADVEKVEVGEEKKAE